jgi:phosphate transport system substrate-binding protein
MKLIIRKNEENLMKKVVLTFALLVSILCSCQAENPKVKPIDEKPAEVTKETQQTTITQESSSSKTLFTKKSFPKIDGSTATIPLSEGIASELLKLSPDEAKKFIKHNTTHNAYVNLVDKKADIILVTEPSDQELAMAKEKNMELEVIPVVKDAFVFLANTKNPIESLTTDQIQKIYQGKITNWKEVGSEDKEIIAYQRPKNSGSQTLMENQVMKGLKMADAPKEYTPAEMGQLIEAVAGYDNSDRAIGYSVFYFANTMYVKDTFKLIGVNGIKPTKETIKKGEYPFTSAYYAVIDKSQPADSNARKLLNWILSNEGQKVADDSGYVPLK